MYAKVDCGCAAQIDECYHEITMNGIHRYCMPGLDNAIHIFDDSDAEAR